MGSIFIHSLKERIKYHNVIKQQQNPKTTKPPQKTHKSENKQQPQQNNKNKTIKPIKNPFINTYFSYF